MASSSQPSQQSELDSSSKKNAGYARGVRGRIEKLQTEFPDMQNIGKRWDANDYEELKTLVSATSQEHLDFDELAKKIGRSPGATKTKVLTLASNALNSDCSNLEKVCDDYHIKESDLKDFFDKRVQKRDKQTQQTQRPKGTKQQFLGVGEHGTQNPRSTESEASAIALEYWRVKTENDELHKKLDESKKEIKRLEKSLKRLKIERT